MLNKCPFIPGCVKSRQEMWFVIQCVVLEASLYR